MTTYPGGKNGAGVYHAILHQMPPHRVYIEPFLGSAAILRRKQPALVNIGIDRDAEVIRSAARAIRGESTGVIAGSDVQDLHAGSGAAHRRLSPKAASADHPAAAARVKSGAAARASTDSSLQASVRAHSSVPALLASVRCSRTESGAGVLASFDLASGDGIRFLERYQFRGDELIYCDPPYVRSARSGKRDLYRYEMTDVDHRRLLRVLRMLPCPVMLSGYWSPLYAAELRGRRSVTFTGVTRGGPATEWLWCNFPEPVELHDPRYVGRNWRERDRINKMKRRWVARLERMEPLQRQALLSAIADLDVPGVQRSLLTECGEGTRFSAPGDRSASAC